MIRLRFVFSILFVMMLSASARAQTNQIQFGWNYFELDSNYMNVNSALALFADSMKSTLYHTGAIPYTAAQWSSGIAGTGNIIALNNAIGVYSSSQRMRYEALPIGNWEFPSDSLRSYYFYNHPLGGAYPTFPATATHWEISDSSSHNDVIVMSGNQFPYAWVGQPTHWFHYYSGGILDSEKIANPWRIAVSLRLQDTNLTGTGNTDTVVEIYAIHGSHDGTGAETSPYDTLRYGVQWDSVLLPNTDYTFFRQQDTFPRIINSGDYINIEVHSKRYTTVRLAWVCVLDTIAYKLTAFTDLNPSDSGLKHLQNAAFDSICADSAAQYSLWSGRIAYYFMANEPTRSQGKSMGVVNQVLKGRGNTEVQWDLFDPPRYLAQVKPTVFWSGGQRVVGGQICEIKDDFDSTYPGGFDYWADHPNPPKSWTLAEETATNTNYESRWWVSYPDFDPFELYEGSWTSNLSASDAIVDSTKGVMAGVASNLNMYSADSAQGWWDNIFNDAFLDYTDGMYPSTSFPALPEQCQLDANLGLLQGAKGILFSQAISTQPDYHYDNWLVGFVDGNINYSSDYTDYSGNNVPTMFQRNTLWAIRYSRFLRNVASVLANKLWLGGFSRNGFEYSPSGFQGVRTITSQSGSIFIEPDSEKMSRPIINTFDSTNITNDSTWMNYSQIYPGNTSLYHWIQMPDTLRWLAEACFSTSSGVISDANPGYLAIMPLWVDARDLLCRWQNDADTGTFVRRGTRMVTTKLNMSASVSQNWSITDIGNGWDTIIPAQGSFTQLYLPAQMRIYEVEPFCNYADRNLMDDSGNTVNGGVHEVKHPDGGYRAVYIRNDSVFERKMTDCGINTEQLVEPGGHVNNKYKTLLCGDVMFPVVYGYGGGGGGACCDTATHYYKVVNKTPVIAEHRGADNDEDMIMWQENTVDSSCCGVSITASIRATPMSYSADTKYDTNGAMIIAGINYMKQDTSFRANPVIAGADSGFGIAYADSGSHIIATGLQGSQDAYFLSNPNVALSAGSNKSAENPSITWGEEHVTGDTADFIPVMYVAWDQKDTTGFRHVWLQSIDIAFHHSSAIPCPVVTTFAYEKVSTQNPWICNNSNPDVSANYSSYGSPDYVHVVWKTEIMNDSLNPDRIVYSLRFADNTGTPLNPNNYYGYFVFASGTEAYSEPNVYVSVPDSNIANATDSNITLRVVWESNHDSVRALTADPVSVWWDSMYTYSTLGKHSTLSYYPGMDEAPSTIGQNHPTPYQLQSVSEDGLTSGTRQWWNQMLGGLSVTPRPGTYGSCGGCCGWYGIMVGISQIQNAFSIYPYYGGNPPIQLFSINHRPTGSGVIENTIVRSHYFKMELGLPVQVPRVIGAANPSALTALLSTGHYPKAIIEIVDSVGDVPLVTLDSFVVSSPADTGTREGTLTYTPDEDFVGFPVYIRARITADSTVAYWKATDVNEVNSPDTSAGLFGKDVRNAGRAGLVPVGDDSVGLVVYPNPFSPHTRIMYTVGVDDANDVTEVKVYNMLAEDVTTLISEVKSAGRYAVEFNAANLPSGQYIVAVHEANHMQSKLIVLTK